MITQKLATQIAKNRIDWTELQWRWIGGATIAVIGLTSIAIFVGLAIYATTRATVGEIPTTEEMGQISELAGIFAGPLLLSGATFIATIWLATRMGDALAKLTQHWSVANDTPVTFSASGKTRRLHPDIETVLLRAAREALNNIQKHAQATQVTATLTYFDSFIALDVADNGQGFEPNQHLLAERGAGFGLQSLRMQAERLSGELSIESAPGKGCTIALLIPTGRGEGS